MTVEKKRAGVRYTKRVRLREPDGTVETYRVLGHRREQPCPLCKRNAFCDDCGICEKCGFTPPEVKGRASCAECGRRTTHTRTCSTTVRAAAS